MENKDKPAYPTNARMHSDAVGLTKREMFAMAAMQGLSSCPIPGSHNRPDEIASSAIKIADELLKQLES